MLMSYGIINRRPTLPTINNFRSHAMKTKDIKREDVLDYKFGYESSSISVELKNGKCFTLRGVRARNFLKQIEA